MSEYNYNLIRFYILIKNEINLVRNLKLKNIINIYNYI